MRTIRTNWKLKTFLTLGTWFLSRRQGDLISLINKLSTWTWMKNKDAVCFITSSRILRRTETKMCWLWRCLSARTISLPTSRTSCVAVWNLTTHHEYKFQTLSTTLGFRTEPAIVADKGRSWVSKNYWTFQRTGGKKTKNNLLSNSLRRTSSLISLGVSTRKT